LPLNLRQALPREGSQADYIKAAIHKLRTETPQFSELGFLPTRSKSYFLDRYSKVKKSEQKQLQLLVQRRSQGREGRCYLPELASNEPKLPDVSTHQLSPQEDCNVILLKRNMRYRLQKLPLFGRPEPPSEQQLNQSVTGWHRNPE
jgi:hypothetical protein